MGESVLPVFWYVVVNFAYDYCELKKTVGIKWGKWRTLKKNDLVLKWKHGNYILNFHQNIAKYKLQISTLIIETLITCNISCGYLNVIQFYVFKNSKKDYTKVLHEWFEYISVTFMKWKTQSYMKTLFLLISRFKQKFAHLCDPLCVVSS